MSVARVMVSVGDVFSFTAKLGEPSPCVAKTLLIAIASLTHPRYSDPDIISLCKQSGELIDPRSTIVNMARALTEKANGFSGLPADPLERLKIIASLSRMKVLPMDMDQVRRERRDAALYPTANGGWTVLYNPNRLKSRIIFTIGHEIVHTFFPNSTNGARFRTLRIPGHEKRTNLNFCVIWERRNW